MGAGAETGISLGFTGQPAGPAQVSPNPEVLSHKTTRMVLEEQPLRMTSCICVHMHTYTHICALTRTCIFYAHTYTLRETDRQTTETENVLSIYTTNYVNIQTFAKKQMTIVRARKMAQSRLRCVSAHTHTHTTALLQHAAHSPPVLLRHLPQFCMWMAKSLELKGTYSHHFLSIFGGKPFIRINKLPKNF